MGAGNGVHKMSQYQDYGPLFDGVTFKPELDAKRLGAEMERVFNCVKDGSWRTLSEIRVVTGDPEASISARLRDFRKERFGSHIVNRRRRGDPKRGLFEYQLII
jgi:hypothetical protein